MSVTKDGDTGRWMSQIRVTDWTGKTIHPFCTHEGSGLAGTERKIQQTCKGAKVEKGLAIHGSSVDGAKAAVEKWV